MILNEFFDSNTNQLRITEGIAPQDNDPWGPQGNFAGDKHVNIGGVTMKIIQVGDIVKYLGQQAKVVGMSKDRKYSRISIGSGFGGSVKDVLTADLKQLGQGVAEGLEARADELSRLEHEVKTHLANGDDYSAKQVASGATKIEHKKHLRKVIRQAMYGTGPGQGGVMEGAEGQVVFSGTGANGGKYKIIQTSPTDFMIHANGKHIDTYSSLQRAMSVLKNEVPGLKQGVAEQWSQKYKSSINCSHPKGFSQKAHCAGKKKHNESIEMEMTCPDCGMCETHRDHENLDEACWKGYHKEGNKKMFGKTYPNCVKNTNEEQEMEEGKRIPRKPGQPANSKKHSDLYTDENPKGTIHGLKFATVEDARDSVSKIRNSGRSHAHKIQAAVAMEQRAKAAGKSEAASVYRNFINSIKKTNESQEDETKGRVRRIQQYLNKEFNANLDVDGVMGPLTKKSIEKFLPSSKKKSAPNPEKTTAVQGAEVKKEYKCPHCGGEMVSEELMIEKKDACYYKVKSRYKVWPSAYASGALVKCRKKGASNWGTKSEGVAEVSDSTKQSYKAKAQAQVKELEPHAKKGEYRDIAQRAIDRRQRGLTRLAGRADAVAAQTLAPRVSEGLTVPEGRPALGQANITTLIQTYKRNEPFAELSFGNSGNLQINRQQMRLIMDHYLKLQTPEEKHDFVYETMSRMLKVIAMFDVYGVDVRSQIAVPPGQSSPVPGAQPQLFELDAGEVKDTRLSRALKQARAEFPTAGSDIEAFLKLVMSNDDRDLAAMKRMQDVNKKQGELLDRIQNIDQKQNQEIGNLESELNRVTAVNQNLERELDRIQSAKPAAAADRGPRKDTAEKPAAEKPAARVDLPVGQDISAKVAKKTDAQLPSKVSYGGPTAYKTTLQPPKYSIPQLQAPAQAQLPAPSQQRGLFPDTDITDVIPRAVAPSTNGIKRNPVISSLDQEITGIFQPAANDPEDQRQANAESRDPKRAIAHTGFGSPEWHEKMLRVGELVKQGPLKTVWDPVKRVYRNVPVDQPANNKPNMNEARLHRRAVLRQILES